MGSNKNIRFGGLVLHSAFLSPFRVTEPCKTSFWFDIYTNVDVLKGIVVPTLILHGARDGMVPPSHSQEMGKTLKEHAQEDQADLIQVTLFPCADHNDVEITCRDEYLAELRQFFV